MGIQNEREYIEKQIERSEDYVNVGDRARTAIRFSLIREATKLNDDQVWLTLGWALIRACNVDDLTPRVSDLFVDNCPVKIFANFGKNVSPYRRFHGWKRRTNQAF